MTLSFSLCVFFNFTNSFFHSTGLKYDRGFSLWSNNLSEFSYSA